MPRLIDRAFCVRCADRMAYEIHVETEELTVRGTEFACVEVFARCCNCGDELYIPEINDLNVELRVGAYAKATSRPHGWWIPFLDGEHIMPERYYRCSRCGRVERRKESYCHCGAKMDLEEEDE